jgi:hypothetical protein
VLLSVLPAYRDRVGRIGEGNDIDMLGRYAFVLPNAVARGERRLLCDPSLVNDDEG